MFDFYAIFGDNWAGRRKGIPKGKDETHLCPIFLDIPTYLKIGHALWIVPKERTLLDMLLTLIFKSRKLSKIRQAVKLKLKSQGLLPNFMSKLTNNCQNVIISV